MGIIDYIEQKNRERVARARWEDAKKIGLGAVLGLLVGGAVGVLTAPQSGDETREDLMNAAKDASVIIRDKAGEFASRAKDFTAGVETKLTSIGPAIESGLDAAGKAYQETAKTVKKEAENVKKEVKETAKEAEEKAKDEKASK
ncbi:MAG: YtxH domain-containing protein [Peptoniphilaceae bacterium]|nr:YtxH domain-containing protein [Peptoniphilaceae bacterium]MDY3075916.1 YtxH domain-containing protein [Peptoniphilaceae bacterium]